MMDGGLKPITIAGGGLAGLGLGLGLRRFGVPVTLHEAGSYPRHRVCGEFISGLGKETIGALGIGECVEGAVVHRRTVWFAGGEEVFRGELPEAAFGISRYRLDERLRDSLVAAGGVVVERSRWQDPGVAGLVWATGRDRVAGQRWLGLKAHFEGVRMEEGLEMHLGEGMYVGVAEIEDGRVNVCGLVRAPWSERGKGVERFFEMMRGRGLSGLVSRLECGRFDDASFVGVSAFTFGKVSQDEVFRIGDAQSLIPPFTGNGMAMALQAAECALPFLVRYARGRCGWAEAVGGVRGALAVRFRRRLWGAAILHPLVMHPFAQRVLCWGGRRGCLPFQTLYRAVR